MSVCLSRCLPLLEFLAEVVLIISWIFIAVQHFLRGGESILHGVTTLVILCCAGWTTNVFNFIRHEQRRQPQRPTHRRAWKVFTLLVPGWSLFSWHITWIQEPSSWSAEYWVSVLRLFHCALGALPQAILQTYLVIYFYYEVNVSSVDMSVVAVFSFLSALFGISNYIWKEYYEEEHQSPNTGKFIIVVFALMLNMGGRIVSLAMAGVLAYFWWMAGGFLFVLSVNYITSLYFYGSGPLLSKLVHNMPIALLHALCITRKKSLTLINTGFWLLLSLPQIVQHNETIAQWLMWGVPFFAQILAVILLLCYWNIVEITFRRFERLLNKGPKLPN